MSGPRPLTSPVPGTYRYSTSGQTVVAGSRVVFPAVTTLVVDPPSGTRQHSTRNLRDGSGNGTATEFTLDYRADGVYLVGLRITTGFSGMTDARDLTPSAPVLLLPTGARPGAHVESDLAAGGGAARLVVDVLRDERLTIGGQVVDTLVMRAVVSLPPGDVTGRQELTVNVDPGSRLWVRERGVADASAKVVRQKPLTIDLDVSLEEGTDLNMVSRAIGLRRRRAHHASQRLHGDAAAPESVGTP